VAEQLSRGSGENSHDAGCSAALDGKGRKCGCEATTQLGLLSAGAGEATLKNAFTGEDTETVPPEESSSSTGSTKMTGCLQDTSSRTAHVVASSHSTGSSYSCVSEDWLTERGQSRDGSTAKEEVQDLEG
jgi:hypothetical protein